MRSIAAMFDSVAAAEDARRRLLAATVNPREVAVAPAAVSVADESPVYRHATIVVVRADVEAPAVRGVLEASGGRLVADVELDS